MSLTRYVTAANALLRKLLTFGTVALLVYPVYFAVAGAVLAGVITLRRNALSQMETLTVANAAEVA